MFSSANLRNYILVTVLTILVWAFAESESLNTRAIRFDVIIDANPAGGRVARVLDGQSWPGRVTLEVQGPAASIDALDKLSSKPLVIAPGFESFPAVAGENALDLRAVISELPEWRGRGVTIQSSDPATLRVVVDEVISRDLPVRVDTGEAQLEDQPQIRPARVQLTLSRKAADALGAELSAVAAIDPQSLSRLVPGRSETLSAVPLRLSVPVPPDAYVRLAPSVADVSLALRSRTASFVLPSVPVHVRLAAAELGRWKIEIPESDRFIPDVRVTGPDDLVDQVRRNELRVVAVVPLSFEELERGITSKEAIFVDVAGPLKYEAERKSVRLTISKIAAPEENPGAGIVPGSGAGEGR